MFEYLKRKFVRMDGKVAIDKFPLYYEKNGLLIKEEADGRRFEIKVDDNGEDIIVRELENAKQKQ